MSDTDFIAALGDKILALEGDKDELEEALDSVEARLEVLQELLDEEGGKSPASTPKKRGRPKGSKNKKTSKRKSSAQALDPVQAEASRMKGTDPEVAERLSTRKFTPAPRQVTSYGPGIHPGVGGPALSGPEVSEHAPGVGDDE